MPLHAYPGGSLPLGALTFESLFGAAATHYGDAFGRQRVGQPVLELDAKFTSDLMPDDFNAPVAGGGTVAKTAGTTRAALSVAAAGDSAALTLRYPLLYRAAQSQLIAMTGVMAAGAANLTQRIGYFDATDGIDLRMVGTALSFAIVDSFGAATDAVAQAAWNIDRFDGAGPSRMTLDTSKGFILAIDMQYLGVGRVRCGFFCADGCLRWAHEFRHVGTALAPYMRTANLRPAWSISAGVGYADGARSMYAICVGAVREGAHEEPGRSISVDRGQSVPYAATANLDAILAVRLKSAYAATATARPVECSVTSTASNVIRYTMVKMRAADVPVAITGGVWTSCGEWSALEYSVVTATITPTVRDVVYDSGHVVATATSKGTVSREVARAAPIGTSAAGASDIILVAVTRQEAGSAASALASMRVEEYR